MELALFLFFVFPIGVSGLLPFPSFSQKNCQEDLDSTSSQKNPQNRDLWSPQTLTRDWRHIAAIPRFWPGSHNFSDFFRGCLFFFSFSGFGLTTWDTSSSVTSSPNQIFSSYICSLTTKLRQKIFVFPFLCVFGQSSPPEPFMKWNEIKLNSMKKIKQSKILQE